MMIFLAPRGEHDRWMSSAIKILARTVQAVAFSGDNIHASARSHRTMAQRGVRSGTSVFSFVAAVKCSTASKYRPRLTQDRPLQGG